MRKLVSMMCDSFNKKGLNDCTKYHVSNATKNLITATKHVMKYRGKNSVDTLNHMCDFLFEIEKSGQTGFIIESLIDQSSIRPIDSAYKNIKSLNSIMHQPMSRNKFAHMDLKQTGYKYVYEGFDYDTHKALLWELTLGYLQQVLYTFIKMLEYIKPDSEDPTDADDVISDLQLNADY